ncbi:MAG: redoxin domain-containing protein [Candidatus Schmidhempelia sp.]|nr:redoxin domain-containing protein [Candidatus Schmidhempelia sp.]
MLKNGIKAPNFTLNITPEQQISLSELIGKKVILAFYPADWSSVCGSEMTIFNTSVKLLEKYNAVVLGISVDSKWSHKAFSEKLQLHFSLLSDFEPKGAVSQLYDVYDLSQGCSKRAIYIIDEKGIIQWSSLSPNEINPGIDGVLDALDKLATEQ